MSSARFHARLCVALVLIPCLAHSNETSDVPPKWSPYLNLSAEADDADSSQTLLELGSSIGAAGWIRGGVGRSQLADAEENIDTKFFKLGGGASIAAVDVAAGLTHRADGDAFEQQDWSFALDWQFGRGAIGADVFIRSAESETLTSARTRRQNPRQVRLVESIDGTGYGIHGDLDITPELVVFASWIKYDYDVETNHPVLARASLLNGSGITRSEAFLDRSFTAGLTYRFVRASLSAQYMHDEALVEVDVTDSAQLSVLLMLGNHWSITPLLGASDNDLHGSTGYAGLTLGYAW